MTIPTLAIPRCPRPNRLVKALQKALTAVDFLRQNNGKISFLFLLMLPLDGVTSLSAAAVNEYTGPIIDAHAHVRLTEDDGLTGVNHPKGTEALRRIDDKAGIEQSALLVIARKGQIEETRAQNDAVIATAVASNGRFYPVVSVHPADGEAALMELDRVARRGAKEVKLHPNSQNFDVADPEVGEVVQRCGEVGLPVLFDSYKPWDTSEIGKFLILSVQHPKTKIVLAHMGLTYFRDILSFELIRRLGMGQNVWFDLSVIAPTYAGSPVQAELVWTIRKVGTDRFLFGSDWPAYTPAETISAVRKLGFDYSEQKQIFHDNTAQLLGLGHSGSGSLQKIPNEVRSSP